MENNLNKDNISKLLILLLLAITLPMAAWLVGQRHEVRKEAAGSGVVKLTLDPTSGNKSRGQSFTVNVKMTATQAKQIYAGEVQLQFISTVFDISGVTCGSNFPLAVKTDVVGDKINLICSRQGGATGYSMVANTPVILGSFTAVVKAGAPAGATTISFTSSKVPEATTLTDLSDAGTTATYTITTTTPTNTPGPTNTPMPTPTGTIAPTPTGTIVPTPTPTGIGKLVNLKVKMIGVDGLPAATANRTKSFRVKFTLASNQSLVGPIYQANGTVDANGIWTIGVPLRVDVAGGTYNIYVKGPMHLQKKFPNISFASFTSEITKDLAALGERYYLEPGDLAISGTNHDQQDGVVNALDAVYLTSTCGLFTEDAACLAKADLDLDGQINAIDIALMNRTVYSRWEDEVE